MAVGYICALVMALLAEKIKQFGVNGIFRSSSINFVIAETARSIEERIHGLAVCSPQSIRRLDAGGLAQRFIMITILHDRKQNARGPG